MQAKRAGGETALRMAEAGRAVRGAGRVGSRRGVDFGMS